MSFFAILNSDDENETPVIKVTNKKDTTKGKESAPAEKTQAKTAAAPAPAAANSQPKTQEKKAATNNASAAPKKENAKPKAPKTEGDAAVPAGDNEKKFRQRDNHDNKGETRGRGKEYRPKQPKEFVDTKADPNDHEKGLVKAPRKREFDRHSSNGRTGEQRKGGGGPHSFGNVKQEASNAEKDPASAEPEVEAVEGETPAPEAEKPVEPVEPPQVTFEEYLKKKSEEKANIVNKELFAENNLRVPEAIEGLKTKAEEETVFMSAAAKKANASKKVAAKTTKPVLDLGFKVAPAEEAKAYERPERSERKGRDFKDGKNEDRGRNQQRSATAVTLNAADFPSL